MLNVRKTALALAIAAASLALPAAPLVSTAAAKGGPSGGTSSSEIVQYTYDSTQSTFSFLVNHSYDDIPYSEIANCALTVNRVTRTDAVYTSGTDVTANTRWDMCQFANVVAPPSIAAKGQLQRPAYGTLPYRIGSFSVSCKNVAANGCTGNITVSLSTH